MTTEIEMTATQTPTTSDTPDAPAEAEPSRDEQHGLAGLLGTGDHKDVGRLYIVLALLFGGASIVAGALARAEASAELGLFSTSDAFSLFTASEVGLVFGFAVPIFLGLAIYLVPLQVGAATIAFPRAAALSLWLWLAGMITLIISYAIDGGIAGAEVQATDLGLLALGMVIVGLLIGAMCVATTVTTLRTEGLTLGQVPMFSWSMLVASALWLLSWPVLLGNLLLVYVDHTNFATGPGQPSQQFAQIAWGFFLPQIYVVAIPVLGFLGDALPAFARRRQPSRGIMYGAIGAFGFFAFGAWAQPAQGGDIMSEPLIVVMSFGVALPLLALLGGWVSAMRGGEPKLAAPVMAGVVAVVVLLVATVAGGLYSVEPLEVQDTMVTGWGVPVALLGHANLVLAATAIGALGALAFWAPKLTGARPSGLAGLVALLGLVGALAWGIAPVVQGFETQVSELSDAAEALAWVSVAGAAVMLVVLLAAAATLVSGRSGDVADDPWEVGQTLEWACPSPPPRGNFGTLEVVRTAEPLLDERNETSEEER
ncbi:MAG: cbb3-type cytochrome c oxidase subunit I [Acidimicrobiia bacterium]|nr:cbb3-type cytochrome c oxidase subunit I [Acidimicrobiia bacterium]